MIMLNYFNILLCCILIFFFQVINCQVDPSSAFFCPDTTSYTSNSTYNFNLISLLSSLSLSSSRPNGFYNTTSGNTGSDIAYGMVLCRGDVSLDDCQNCIAEVVKTFESYCPNKRNAVLWVDECLIRRSDQPSFGSTTRLTFVNTQNVSEPQRFSSVLGNVMNELAADVAAKGNDSWGKIFGSKEANFTSLETLYTFAQCIPDVYSSSSCGNCLRTAIGNLPSDGTRGGRVLLPGCNVRFELYPFYNVAASTLPPTTPTSNERGKGGIASGVIVAIVIPIVVSILLFIFAFCWIRSRTLRESNVEEISEEISTAESLQYQLNTIRAATTNFSIDNKIGEGGFGPVYKGKLPDGQEIAVKRLSRRSGQGVKEFKNEIVLIAKLQHRYLVRLLGYCFEGDEKILVYELVPNKSLNYFLFVVTCHRSMQCMDNTLLDQMFSASALYFWRSYVGKRIARFTNQMVVKIFLAMFGRIGETGCH